MTAETNSVKPDKVYSGQIMYTIEQYGTESRVSILNQGMRDKIAMYHSVYQDLVTLEESFKKNPKGVKKNFAQIDRQRITGARFIVEKFINRFLNTIASLEAKQKEQSVESDTIVPERMEENNEPGGETIDHREGEL